MGCPIKSSMDVISLGKTPQGLPVYLDRYASKADHIIVVNRIKEHTNFDGEVESGLCKMLAIGTGKQAQAIAIHAYGLSGLQIHMPEVAKVILEKAPVTAGFAILEDAGHCISELVGVSGDELVVKEKELLNISKSKAPRLPIEDIDLVILDEFGKNISGTGIDTRVVGRCRLLDFFEFDTPRVRAMVALDLTEETHGNAIGMGLCDIITRRLADKIEPRVTAVNVITGLCPALAAQPITLATDEEVIRTALDYFCGHVPFDDVKVIHVKNTLCLTDLKVSEAVAKRIDGQEGIELLDDAIPMAFDRNGTLLNYPDKLEADQPPGLKHEQI